MKPGGTEKARKHRRRPDPRSRGASSAPPPGPNSVRPPAGPPTARGALPKRTPQEARTPSDPRAASSPPTAPPRSDPNSTAAPAPGSLLPRTTPFPTFLRSPLVEAASASEVDVLLLGVPFDGGAAFRPGARFAPRAIRQASALSQPFSAALGIDFREELRVGDGGDLQVGAGGVEDALERVAEAASDRVRGGVVVGFVGGDQTLTLGALRGIHRAKLRAIGLLHVDCHSNTHASVRGVDAENVVRVAVEEGLVRPDAVLQIGLRGPYGAADELSFALSRGFELVDMDEIKWDLHSAISSVRKLVRAGPVYVSVDLHALDPAFAPGVGAPVPGGMNSWELQQVLRALVGADVVGFDVVELVPDADVTGVTALSGVMVLQEILAALADTRRSASPAPSTRDPRRDRRVSA